MKNRIVVQAVFLLGAALNALTDLLRPKHITMANAELGAGTHDAAITKLTDAAITRRHLLYMDGSDDDHAAVTSAITDIPLGTIADEATAAEEEKAVLLLGRGATKRMVASGHLGLTVGALVYTDTGGKVTGTNYTQGACYQVGIVVSNPASAENDIVEVNDHAPIAVTLS